MLIQGQLQNQVARHFGVNVSTIERLVRRLRETGRLADRPRSGRPRVTSRRQDRYIVVSHVRNRRLTAVESALIVRGNHGHPISLKTVRNQSREVGVRAKDLSDDLVQFQFQNHMGPFTLIVSTSKPIKIIVRC